MTNSQADSQAHLQGGAQDRLYEEYTIDTPENVTFGYEVAGIGSRFIGALIDNLILGVLLLGLNIAVFVLLAYVGGNNISMSETLEETDQNWVAGLVIAIYALLNFAIWWSYYLLSEWLWHGKTVGKRIARIRVVRLDGSPVSFVPIAVRNLVRIIDFLPMGYGVGVVTMFCNRQARRLGDFAAGTLVVKDQGELTLDSLLPKTPSTTPSIASVPPALVTSPTVASAPVPASFSTEPFSTESISAAMPSSDAAHELTPDQDWSGIRRLTPADYELVQETIARYRADKLDRALLARVAGAIATKLNRASSLQLDQVTTADPVTFLTDVAAAYGRWVR